MDKREARQYICSNPPFDPCFVERRPSFLGSVGRLIFSRSRSNSESDAPVGLQRRGSIDTASLTQKLQQVQQTQKPPAVTSSSNEINIFT